MVSITQLRYRLARERITPDRVATSVRRRWKRLISPELTFLERNHDIRNTLLLASTGRSGSTWLAEVLVDPSDCRYIFESLHYYSEGPFTQFTPGRYFGDQIDYPPLEMLLRRVFSGRVRIGRSDQHNKSRRPSYRLLKEAYITNVLPAIQTRFPEVPIIYLLRHPVACAWSWTRLNWGCLGEYTTNKPFLDRYFAPQKDEVIRQAFIGNVYRWCLENKFPLACLSQGSVLVVFYEDLIAHRDREFDRIKRFLADRSQGKWREWSPNLAAVDRPSATAYPDVGEEGMDGREMSLRWTRQVPQEWIAEGVETLRLFGLDWIYGEDPWPRLAADDVLSQRS